MRTFAASQSTPVKFERITSVERQHIAVKSTEVRNFRDQRNHWEAPAGQPASQRPPPTASKPAPTAKQPVAPPPTKPAKEVKPAKSTPMPEVRVTRPEQVVVPSPAITPKPSESRYIEKEAPGRPAQEHYRTDTTSTTKSPGKDSRGKSQPNDSQGKDRKR